MRPIALLVGPYRNATEDDARVIRYALGLLCATGWAPLWYPHVLAGTLDDRNPESRLVALQCSAAMVAALARSRHLVAVFEVRPQSGVRSEGMLLDIGAWVHAGGQASLVIPWEQVTSAPEGPHKKLRALRENLERSVIGWPAEPGGTGPRGGS